MTSPDEHGHTQYCEEDETIGNAKEIYYEATGPVERASRNRQS
jgi:hypothetical protein